MSATYEQFKGKIILIATLNAKEGKCDELEKLLMAVHAYSNSSSEPGCLVFRVTRFKGKFFIFEEYANADAVTEHFKSLPFKNFLAVSPDVAPAGPQVEYYEECASA